MVGSMEKIILRRVGAPDRTVEIPLTDSGSRFQAVGEQFATEHDYKNQWWLRESDSDVFVADVTGSRWNPPVEPFHQLGE
jgi:hypothetical protein